MKIVNPATHKLLADIPADTAGSVAAKYQRACEAQVEWARTPLTTRVEALRRFGALLTANADELALVLTREMGKPIKQARNELGAMPSRIDYFLGETAAVMSDEVVFSDGDPARPKLKEIIAHEPLGVIANISAWNYPYFVGSNVFVPALLTGNAVLYKPSEFATMTGLRIADLLQQAGVAADAFLHVVGAGNIGAALLRQPINGVFFTGSYGTGRKVAETVAPRLIHTQLELGGKDPTYVCEDVDVARAAEGLADGAFYNAGQSCCSVERLYVHKRIYDAFVEAFVATVDKFVVGDPEDEATYIGPLAREAQLDVLASQVADAVKHGAKVRSGGKRLDRTGFYFAPTVLANASHEMQVMRDESFGPIIGIQSVSDDDEAVRLMNDTDYGLTAGVYSKDSARATRILRQIAAGSVYWNCCDRVSPRLPWTGRKHSGIGSTMSHAGIRAFLQPKAWHLRGA